MAGASGGARAGPRGPSTCANVARSGPERASGIPRSSRSTSSAEGCSPVTSSHTLRTGPALARATMAKKPCSSGRAKDRPMAMMPRTDPMAPAIALSRRPTGSRTGAGPGAATGTATGAGAGSVSGGGGSATPPACTGGSACSGTGTGLGGGATRWWWWRREERRWWWRWRRSGLEGEEERELSEEMLEERRRRLWLEPAEAALAMEPPGDGARGTEDSRGVPVNLTGGAGTARRAAVGLAGG